MNFPVMPYCNKLLANNIFCNWRQLLMIYIVIALVGVAYITKTDSLCSIYNLLRVAFTHR